ncbi:MAG: 3-deoxy-manno-octulosonate cytidylyltransferase [Acidobacteria bacterium]|nr:3-deoxy-manno-octulosonate cytidylyltransferase [Acidobacteriota bacterium]
MGRAVAVIPARFHSTRLPGKPLLEIDGRPMIEHVYRRATRARSVATVIVATDDDRIASVVRSFGGDVRMTRGDHFSATDRVAEVAERLECELVVNLQGDEPLIDPQAIDSAVEAFDSDRTLAMSTLCRAIDDPAEYTDPHVVKVVKDRDGFALYFSRAPIPFSRDRNDAQLSAAAFKHLGLYVYRRPVLLDLARLEPTPLEISESLEQLRALEHGYRIRVVETRTESIGVDTPGDLERVRRMVAGVARV